MHSDLVPTLHRGRIVLAYPEPEFHRRRWAEQMREWEADRRRLREEREIEERGR